MPPKGWSTVVKVADAGSQLFECSREESLRVSSCEPTVFKHARSASRGSGLKCPSQSGQIGGSDDSVGRIRPHVFHITGGAQESQGPGARATCGRAYCVLENVHRAREEEDWMLSRRCCPGPGRPRPGSGEAPIGGAKSRGRKFHPLCRQSCVHVCRNCDGRTPNCVQSCSPVSEAEKKEGASSPRVCPILPSIWFLNRNPGPTTGLSQPVLNAGCADASSRMETLIETADANLRSNRFNPLSG